MISVTKFQNAFGFQTDSAMSVNLMLNSSNPGTVTITSNGTTVSEIASNTMALHETNENWNVIVKKKVDDAADTNMPAMLLGVISVFGR